MDLLCEQIGLSTDFEAIKENLGIISRILLRLRGYSDNGPIRIDAPGRLPEEVDPEAKHDYELFLAALNTLSNHKIIAFKPEYLNRKWPGKDMYRDFSIFVTNRYELERLKAELKWLVEPKDRRSNVPHVYNLVFYNPLSGEGLVNGKYVRFKKSKPRSRVKSKELFDLLFASAPNPVPRERLIATLRLGKDTHDESDRITQAFSNIRRRCGVDKNVISLNDSGVLNAITVPIDELPHSFIFTE